MYIYLIVEIEIAHCAIHKTTLVKVQTIKTTLYKVQFIKTTLVKVQTIKIGLYNAQRIITLVKVYEQCSNLYLSFSQDFVYPCLNHRFKRVLVKHGFHLFHF